MKTNINYISALKIGTNRNKMRNLIINYKRDLSSIDKKISIINHIIENEDMNSLNTVTIFKKLKALRVERRAIKNDIVILEELKKNFYKYNIKLKGFKDPLFSKEVFNKIYNSKVKELKTLEKIGINKYNKNVLDLI